MDVHTALPFLKETVLALLNADSPSGYTARAVAAAESIAQELGYPTRRSNKGNLTIFVEGEDDRQTLGLCAHVDTIGLMVRSINEKGELLFSCVGGPLLPSLDGEYCTVYTRGSGSYTGTILSMSPSVHVYDDAATRPRDAANMCVRLDEKVHSADDVRALGIEVGDYICIDPKTVLTESGFLKSRFIDDKGSAAILLTALKLLHDSGRKPRCNTEITLSVYEEVGHGGATFSEGLSELLVVDMDCVGQDLGCDEYSVSICAKDNGGPYDYEMVSNLIELANAHGLSYAVDVYSHYTSDAAAAWRAGCDVRAALIGPGVAASHGMERTHLDGMEATLRLVLAWLGCF
jgi:putative aminopeptidase FrvX